MCEACTTGVVQGLDRAEKERLAAEEKQDVERRKREEYERQMQQQMEEVKTAPQITQQNVVLYIRTLAFSVTRPSEIPTIFVERMTCCKVNF